MLDPDGEDWSIGHLITIDGRNSRLVGVICEISTVRQKWSEGKRTRPERPSNCTARSSKDCRTGRPFVAEFARILLWARLYAGFGSTIFERFIHFTVVKGSKWATQPELRNTSGDQYRSVGGAQLRSAGTTGVGKTTTVSMLIARAIAAQPNLRVMILDPHNEYEDHFADQACVVYFGKSELPAWMFRFDELSNVIFGNRAPQPDERDALYEVIQCSKTIYFAHHSVSTTGMTLTLLRQPTVEKSGDNAGYAYSVYGERRYCNYR